jgi:hypothetical protein
MQQETRFCPEELEIVPLPEREALSLVNVNGNSVIRNSFNQILKNLRIK